MKCNFHPTIDAVGQCGNCGTYLCGTCLEATSDAKKEYGVLCPECYKDLVHSAISLFKKLIKQNIVRIIVSTILYIIGIILLSIGIPSIKGAPGMFSIITIFLGFLFCGFYTAIAGVRAGKQAAAKQDERFGASYVVDSNGNVRKKSGFIYKLIYFLIYMLFGVIATPFNIVISIFKIVKFKKDIKEGYAKLEKINSI